MQEWEAGPANLPYACVLDVVGNLYNSNTPATVPGMQDKLTHKLKQDKGGIALDLDTLLEVLMEEHAAGRDCCGGTRLSTSSGYTFRPLVS